MPGNGGGYWSRLWSAVLNRQDGEVPGATVEVSPPPRSSQTEQELASRAAGLELDIEERDARILAMREEYETLQERLGREIVEAGDRSLEMLFQRLAVVMAQIDRMAALQKQGRSVDSAEVLALAADVEREAVRVGLERIGSALEAAMFDPRLHMRLSGSAPSESTPVTVVSSGYQYKGKVVLKATVTIAAESR